MILLEVNGERYHAASDSLASDLPARPKLWIYLREMEKIRSFASDRPRVRIGGVNNVCMGKVEDRKSSENCTERDPGST